MARANLVIAEELNAVFANAQDAGSDVRAIKVSVAGETLVCSSSHARINDSAQADWDAVLLGDGVIEENVACIVLYCIDDLTASVFTSTAAGTKKWCLICWVPENSAVRSKMLYTSSREDLKKTLGKTLFESEYGANSMDELKWSAFKESVDPQHSKNLYQSEKERLLQEEAETLNSESAATAGKSVGMGMLPFTLAADVTAAVQALQADDESISILELYVHDEIVSLTHADAPSAEGVGVGSRVLAAGSVTSFQEYVNEAHGRFYIIKCPAGSASAGTYFVFSCPESTAVRTRMTLSSCKATVMHKLTEASLNFTKTCEIREPADIDEYIGSGAAGGADAANAGSLAPTLKHAKPKSMAGRGGKRSSIVKKFTADA